MHVDVINSRQRRNQMATAIRRSTRNSRFGVFMILTAVGVASFCLGFVSGHHIDRIEKTFEKFKAVYASNEQTIESQSLNGRQLFPADDPWNTDISGEPVD